MAEATSVQMAHSLFTDILKPGGHWMSKFFGILLSAIAYHCLILVISPDDCKRTVHAGKQVIAFVNALVLSAAYLFLWTRCDAHDGKALQNTPFTEVPLMLTAGYYLVNLFPAKGWLDACHHLLSIGAILDLLIEGRGANVGVAFAFLVEIATLVYILRNVAVKSGSPYSVIFVWLYPIVFVLVRVVVLSTLSGNILKHEDLPEIAKYISAILYLCSFVFCGRMILNLRKSETPRGRRSRSKTPRRKKRARSKARNCSSRSRSRNRHQRKKCCR